MTMKLSFCLKAATTLDDATVSALTDLIEAYTKAGMPVAEAELAAVNDLVAQADAERAELTELVRQQHANLFAPESDQYRTYEAWIRAGKAVPPGMLEQILMDTRLEDGEAQRLLAMVKAPPAPPAPALAAEPPKPTPNKVFTEDAAAKARELLKRRLGGGTLTSGIDPEILQAGITLAGYHIERGARTFAAYVEAMLGDLGEAVRPYLKSWYAAVYFDPRAAAFQAEMTALDRLEQETATAPAPDVPAPAATEGAERVLVEHVTKGGKGKTIRGVIRTDLTKEQAKQVDEYTFQKDGGWFIREKHLEALDAQFPAGAAPAPVISAPPAAASLPDQLYDRVKASGMPADNIALKKMVAEIDGAVPTQERMKQAQEALESVIVRTARDIIGKKQATDATFDMLVRLYESQPNLNVRTSTSIENQAYSTPAPLAFLASKLAGITPASVAHEPTAGTGMLLIGADPGKALVNELEPYRAELLRAQGFEVTTQDAAAATVVTPGTADAVITNPPFGRLPEKVRFGGYLLGQIDHLIAARALEAMKDDGRAVLILGANKITGGASNDDVVFFNWLRAHYQVTAQFEVDGDLYKRQGAGWPVRVVVIDGRGPSADRNPNAYVQRASDWKGVYGQFEQALAAERPPAAVRGEQPPGAQPSAVPVSPAGAPREPAGGRSGGGAGRAPDVPGSGTGTVGDRGAGAAGPVAGSPGPVRPAPEPAAGPVGGVAPEVPGAGQPPRATREPGLTAAENQFQARYVPRSANQDKGILIPVNMAGPTQEALDKLEDAVGDIDEYARAQLGYDSVEDMHEVLMGLQVDSVASAIYQISQRQRAVIIADQTGIGKGRQAAAMIRWAVRQGRVPVFVSVKPQLFTDMHGDLRDIGSDEIQPLILNVGEWITSPDGERLFANKPGAHRRALEEIAATGQLPDGRDALFMTYSQINVDNVQRRAVQALAPRALFVLDESHNAAGDSATGDYIKSVLELGQAVYLSATYAKRPDNMPLYFKTDMGDAIADDALLADAMSRGGLALQTVVSNNLVKAGQMFRRERSYDGVSIRTIVDTGHRAEHEALADATTAALRGIVAADRQFHEGYIKELQKEAAAEGARLKDIAGNQANRSINHTEFSSVVHNFVRQMLLGLRAQETASRAIATLKEGKKPLIALENTMGSFLSEYVAANGIKEGDSLGRFDYRNVLSRALERSRAYVEVTPTGDEIRRTVTLDQLDGKTRKAYQDAQATIDALDLTIPVSPIDWMRQELVNAGYTVAEITGRDLAVDYSDPKNPKLTRLEQAEQKDKVRTRTMFNSGKLDALVLNVAGSTGISLHASEKFTDQRVRRMIVAQAAQDINIFMQMLGRTHRTGQVVLPEYEILTTDLPAEKRPTTLLSKKMKSLNANTSSNTESATSIDAPDMLNKYGDQIVHAYLVDNPALGRALLGASAPDQEGEPEEDLARKATGRLALMPVKVQEQFYAEVEQQYQTLIDYLTRTNQNDLEPRTFDFEAKELKQHVLYEGQDKATPFGEDAIYGEYSIKAQGKPMTPAEVQDLIKEHLGGKDPQAFTAGLRGQMEALYQPWAQTLEPADQVPAQQARARMLDFLARRQLGARLRVEINGDLYNAVVTNLRWSSRSGNPYSMSKLQVTLAIAGALRNITAAATQVEKITVSEVPSSFTIAELFRAPPRDEREVAKIITGNLLGAYQELKDVKGTIISFTREDGSIEQGILLPKKFVLATNTYGDFRLPDGASALRFLQASQNPDIARFGIMNREGTVRAMPSGPGVLVQVPKSKAKGARYFLDPGLREQLGDFVSVGSFMRASTQDPARAAAALDLLMKKSALYAVPSMAEEAKAITGQPDLDLRSGGAVTAPDVREGDPDADDAAAVARVETQVGAALKGLKLTALPRLPRPELTDHPAIKERYASQQLVRGVFGIKPVWFSANMEAAPNGIRSDLAKGMLLINEAAERPALAVIGHELTHSLRSTHPALYKRLNEMLEPLLRNEGEFRRFLSARRRKHAMPDLSDAAMREELIADIVGDNFMDADFWRALTRAKPGLFRRILGAVRDFLDDLLKKLTGKRPYGTEHYLSDVIAARDAVAQVLAEYASTPEASAAAAVQQFELSEPDRVFFSELERAVRLAPSSQATAQGWLDWLRGQVRKGAFKQDELTWTGLEDFIKAQPGKVQRQALVDFLAGNGVQVTETVLGDTFDTAASARQEQQRLGHAWGYDIEFNGDTYDIVEQATDEAVGIEDLPEELQAALLAAAQREQAATDGAAKYDRYTLPGGTNYREVLLTLPTKKTHALGRATRAERSESDYYAEDPEIDHILRYLGNSVEIGVRTDGQYHLILDRDEWVSRDLSVLEQRLAIWAAHEGIKGAAPEGTFATVHWDQLNVLAHIRLDDRVDADGKRVLFVEEIQSDWGQAGKKYGFMPKADEAEIKMREAAELRAQATALEREMRAKVREFREANPEAEQISDELVAWRREKIDKISDLMQQSELAAGEAQVLLGAMQSTSRVPQAPFVGKTDAWVGLALKRIIKLATNEGYDRVAFVTGEQAAARFSLDKQVDSIEWKPRRQDGWTKQVTVRMPGENPLNLGVDDTGTVIKANGPGFAATQGRGLDEVIGKELAEKIMGLASGQLSGEGLKIEAVGMRTFYDQIVPKVAKEVLKKFGGEKLGTVDIGGPRLGGGSLRQFDVTEVTRDEAMREVDEQGSADTLLVVSHDGDLRNPKPANDAVNFYLSDYAAGLAGESYVNRLEDRGVTNFFIEREVKERLQPGFDVTDAMREATAGGLPMFDLRGDRRRSRWFDATNRLQFAPGKWLFTTMGKAAGPLLSKLQLKPMSDTLARQLRVMKLEVQKAQETAVELAGQMHHLSDLEREMVSDIIEQELDAGITPPDHAVRLAAAMQQKLTDQSRELVSLGMLSQEAAERWEGKYLPRFYESKLRKQVADVWTDAVRRLTGRTSVMRGIRGKHLKGRGMWETIAAHELEQWQELGWEVRDPEYQDGDAEVQIWRDYTREERDDMGEIRDAGFRFVLGYMATQRDLALGRMFLGMATDPEISSRVAKDGWVRVPDTIVEGTGVKRYGKLAGRYVPQDVMTHLSQIEEAESAAWRAYRKAMGLWKEGKTALNPVSHMNNIVSNITMAHFAGVSYHRADKYVAAVKDFAWKSPKVTEAKEAGLFLGTMTDAELFAALPKEMAELVAKGESATVRGAGFVYDLMTFFLRKPMGAAYRAEDTFFRYLIYRDARDRGASPQEAVEWAQEFIFTYDDLPKGARMVRDFGIPFFSYTYKAVPALLHAALVYPWRFAAPAAVLWAANAAAYAIAVGDDDDDWYERLRKYMEDPAYREKAIKAEELEREHLPPWMRGHTSLGTYKTVRLGTDELTKLPLFIDVARFVPGGDIFDVSPNAGGIPLPQPLTPSHPLFTSAVAMIGNKDLFSGKPVVDLNDDRLEAAQKRSEWLWRQLSPAITAGNTHWERGMNALAQATDGEVSWLPERYTGIDKGGQPVQPKHAVMQTFGIKVRPIDLEKSEAIEKSLRNKVIRDIDTEIRRLARLRRLGAISDNTFEKEREKAREKKERLREGLTVDGDTR